MDIGRINWKEIFENSEHWSVKIAKLAIERFKKYKNEGKIRSNEIVIRCAGTPTGVYHIGRANEIIRSYFIAKAIEILGYPSKIIFTSDDRDPARGFPEMIVDKDGYIVRFPENLKRKFEEKYNGFPVCNIPDPFKCHSSWAEHFINVFLNELNELEILNSVKFEYYSPNNLYITGEWDDGIKKVLENKEKIKEIYREYKQHIREYAFSPICEKCGRIGTTIVLEYDKENEKVRYICGGRHLKKKTVEGCGYEGYTSIRNGKLEWYIEWAWNWKYFETIVEPMGKDHWVSSWKISPRFSREIFDWEEPIPLFYDYFTIDGKKISGSKGNVYNITEFLRIIEPEIFLYFYTKKPDSERDIAIENIFLLVDEFDKFEERIYKTLKLLEMKKISLDDLKNYKIVNEENLATVEDLTVYYLVKLGNIEKEKPFRLPYTFASIIGQVIIPRKYLEKTDKPFFKIFNEKIDNILERIAKIVNSIYKVNLSYFELIKVFERCRKAGYWGIRYAPELYKISINEEKIEINLNSEEKTIIKNIIDIIKNSSEDYTELQTKIHNLIKEKTDPKEFYKKLYKILLKKETGPKIANLILAIGKEKFIEILNKYV
ncbi:MAG: lysine--tRNA ligase [Candidatus Aenigmatarchaeota archaeon]